MKPTNENDKGRVDYRHNDYDQIEGITTQWSVECSNTGACGTATIFRKLSRTMKCNDISCRIAIR